MPPLTVGSFCSGYGGLEIGLASVLDIDVRWHAEIASGAVKVLEHHYPDVPNLGDLTAVDYTQVEPVDVVCAGFPCQDLSYAGRGAGIKEGTRSGLWRNIIEAVRVLRPRFVVLENVAAIVARRPGLDVVLADLAQDGWSAEWACVRASDVDAPHRRERWFCVATHADDGVHGDESGGMAGTSTSGERGDTSTCWRSAIGSRRTDQSGDGRSAAADTERRRGRQADTRRRGLERQSGVQAGRDEGAGPSGPGASVAADAADPRPQGAVAGEGGIGHDQRRDQDAADSEGDGWDEGRPEPAGHVGRPDAAERSDTDWGDYRPAIERWARVVGRRAPVPTVDLGRGPRLNPALPEWMMGLPDGWVTGVPGLSRNEQLSTLGNGVVPQQAAFALSRLLPRLLADVTEPEKMSA